MPSDAEIKEVLAMMAGYHELKLAIETGKPSSTAGSAMAMLERAIEARMDTEERMLNWMEASCDARQRMIKSQRRTT
jgi:hypothetical protein